MEEKGDYMNKDIFEQDVRGFLFFPETTLDGIDKYKLIFEYNPQVLAKLREGDIVGVESFATLGGEKNKEKIYALLEVTKINPTHITVDRLKKFRFMGAAREFLKKATKDFEEDPRLIRDHLYIETEAVPTPYIMRLPYISSNPQFEMKFTKPILGRDAGLLKAPEIIEKMINYGVGGGIGIGKLYAEYEEKKKVEVKVLLDKMITHHYSLFGFTGHGKSNFNATILTRLMQIPEEKKKLTAIIFDLSDEYTALLIDCLFEKGYIVVDEEDLPESVIEYLTSKSSREYLDRAAEELSNRCKKPGKFDNIEFVSAFKKVFKKLLEEERIRIIKDFSFGIKKEIRTLSDFLTEMESRCSSDPELLKKFKIFKENFLMRLKRDGLIENLLKLDEFEINKDSVSTLSEKAEESISEIWQRYEAKLRALVKGICGMIKYDIEIESEGKKEIPEPYCDLSWIVENFIKKYDKRYSLCILVSSNKTNMMSGIRNVIEETLRERRRGTRTYDVLFLIDEAHEFVINPREYGAQPEERECSRVIERLTRMGRKYGLGVCISSQRVAYLNTTALSNCHTTFLGAVPRKYDRTTINDAYGISQDVLNQIVTFPQGHWYVVSTISTGMKNVPIRVVAENREKELAKFFDKDKLLTEKGREILQNAGYL